MIVSSISLLAFAREHGKMQVGNFTNKETGEQFKSAVFSNEKGRTFAHFSEKIRNKGIPTPQVLARDYAKYQVVTNENGNFILCEQGENQWEDVNLPL